MDLQLILQEHLLWLQNKGGKRADLRYADFTGTNLIGVNLSYANLKGARMSSKDLRDIDFSYADLTDSDFSYSILTNVNFSNADLSDANMRYVIFKNTYMRYAILKNTDMNSADMSGADVINANLKDVDFSGAILKGVILKYSNLYNAKLPMYSDLTFAIQNDRLIIDRTIKTFEEWKEWFENSNKEFSIKRNTVEFAHVQAMFYAYDAYYKFLNSYQ
jgi:uncharacterized protein YjbI with pentapeptide repeats